MSAAGGDSDAARRARRPWLLASVVVNLGLLGVFKYFNFFAGSLTTALGQLGIDAGLLRLDITLPVGISFYTFQTMSYTIDIYRGKLAPTRRFFDFALFVSYFPQLVAGPIERASVLLPQILSRRSFRRAQLGDGLQLIFWGLFKKVYVADNLAPVVDRVFAAPAPSGFDVLVGTYCFAFQIYCDFSGYSDIARGLAKCMGMELRLNFDHPYVAANPSDFWRRWHVSLSSWLRDYLYISLGGNRGGSLRTYRNLCLTMLLGGLWHGAAWNFVLWGAYQGALLVVHRLLAPLLPLARAAGSLLAAGGLHLLKVLLLFQCTCYGWLLFRARSMAQISTMTRALVCWRGSADVSLLKPLARFAGPLLVLDILQHASGTDDLHRLPGVPAAVKCIAYTGVFYLFAFYGASAQSFIYFQF
jgi:D-alanyl-lipoteichoic acid acyltransferase DltB (MBOAT superfamily)